MDNIEFIKEVAEKTVSQTIAERLNQITYARTALWLVPGGSAAKIAALASHQLKQPGNLIVSLTDERYGPPGHNQSNWRQLKEGGFEFPPRVYEVLSGQSLRPTAKTYSDFLEASLQAGIYIVGLLGMGPDGHIAGILPASPAVASPAWATHFEGPDFTRLTITGTFVPHIHEAFVYAKGPTKHSQIKRLNEAVSEAEQPAQLLKRVAQVRFFNDFLGS